MVDRLVARATTDADSRVPSDWLVRQLAHAERGADAVAGIVEIDDWREQPEAVRRRFAEHYAIHYHVWTPDSFVAMVDWIRRGPAPFASVWTHPGGGDPVRDIEFYAVLTK